VPPTDPQDRLPIELLYWEGCPSYPEALALLRTILAERGIETEVELREVRTHEEAEALAFPGSPTIRIRGHDVDPVGAKAQPALACRIYRLPDGRVSPVPSREQLEEALR
jgi:hypothetical protein